jgi:hypothetical protein
LMASHFLPSSSTPNLRWQFQALFLLKLDLLEITSGCIFIY